MNSINICFNRFVKILTVIAIVLSMVSSLSVLANADEISVSAKSAVLIDSLSEKVIYEKDSQTKRSMASTTKIMTAVLAIENCDLNKTVSISKEAVGIEGSSIYLFENEQITMENLVFSLMLESANDAAAAIAIEISGSIEAFACKMNQKAKELGLQNTSFENPHGLDGDNHYTTAYDLAKLTAYALKNETFKRIVSTYKLVIPMHNGESSRLLLNHNRLLKSYEGAIGVKTGYTKKSGRCLVAAAEKNGVLLISVTLDAPDDWNDHKKMLDYGFSKISHIILAEEQGITGSAHVVGGVSEKVEYSSSNEVSANLINGAHDVKKVVEMSRFYYAPIKKGDVLGRVVFYENNSEIGSTDIVAVSSIEKNEEKISFWKWIISIFK